MSPGKVKHGWPQLFGTTKLIILDFLPLLEKYSSMSFFWIIWKKPTTFMFRIDGEPSYSLILCDDVGTCCEVTVTADLASTKNWKQLVLSNELSKWSFTGLQLTQRANRARFVLL